MSASVIVLGAGMVGVSVALHLRRRGRDVLLVDRQDPGLGASFGNAGLIQREAVHPHPFPREMSEILRIARNRSVDAHYHLRALPGLVSPLLRYWWNSEPGRFARIADAYAALIRTCLDEHMAIARDTEAMALMRPVGWLRVYADAAKLEAGIAEAEAMRREHGVNFAALDARGLAAAEPHLQQPRAGAIHWTDPVSVTDPHGLVMAYFRRFAEAGGRFVHGDATTLTRGTAGWSVQTSEGRAEAAAVVIALGTHADRVTRRFGYAPPLFGKRGYHRHYALRGNAVLNHTIVDTAGGFVLAPMRAGIRLTTGAEFAPADAPATPVQLARAEPLARALLPLGEQVEQQPWMGIRPCTPDMLPIIGPLPGQKDAWCAFGHAHQGFTLGPTTGRLIAEMMAGETPFIDPTPYRADRF
ncbi:FAD-binding oxidoreductase [Roseomonas alkaliterrae]|uniref:D-amino-acid dehydrogenase n=1 Tax=Neoroseomonas alkaliterrae TaxID=1452450 RepID=A0A840XHT0_9PROT|nr:FAD-binding oxidoreductase [Neoroseomonas alkaliterrae]MBB5688035.1 D-amino-acid dehydrogenase [Neoroseomonas alkaliterrae]MBR0675919.1 FAD-binding oxidoreductase [Neoroseomonas alkaliterrae]